MCLEEVNSIIAALSKLNIIQMEISDQLLYISSVSKFAESIKPLIVKYANKLPENSTSFFKL